MSEQVSKVVYFEKPGRQNTDETLSLAKERAEKLGVKNIIVASTTGATGVKASQVFKNCNLIVVTIVLGYKEPKASAPAPGFLPKNRRTIERNGGRILTATHAFGTLGRAVHRKFGAIQVDEIIANVLRLFSVGVKVACEVTCMATDAGLIGRDEEAIGIGGTGYGADTALVLKPSNTHEFFDMRVKEIICKPRL